MKKEEDELKKECFGYLRKPLLKNELIAELMKTIPFKQDENGNGDLQKEKDKQSITQNLLLFIESQMNNLKMLEDQMAIDEIEHFADSLIKKAGEESDGIALSLGNQLKEYCKNFDIPAIKKIFNRFYSQKSS